MTVDLKQRPNGQRPPYRVDLVAGRKYAWCACGRSRRQPFCDGAPSGRGILPEVFKAEATKTAWFCGCKANKSKPICDVCHNRP